MEEFKTCLLKNYEPWIDSDTVTVLMFDKEDYEEELLESHLFYSRSTPEILRRPPVGNILDTIHFLLDEDERMLTNILSWHRSTVKATLYHDYLGYNGALIATFPLPEWLHQELPTGVPLVSVVSTALMSRAVVTTFPRRVHEVEFNVTKLSVSLLLKFHVVEEMCLKRGNNVYLDVEFLPGNVTFAAMHTDAEEIFYDLDMKYPECFDDASVVRYLWKEMFKAKDFISMRSLLNKLLLKYQQVY